MSYTYSEVNPKITKFYCICKSVYKIFAFSFNFTQKFHHSHRPLTNKQTCQHTKQMRRHTDNDQLMDQP